MAKIYSVSQINNYIKNMFDSDFVLENVNISGEVSNCRYHTSGHVYFTLKDGGTAISAIMFAGSRPSGLKFRMTDGQQVVVTGKVSVYEAAGTYQIYAKSIREAGAGELYEKYLKLKEELKEMGMFEDMYKKSLPAFVNRLGVVTAETGAAVQDIINIATRRNPYISIILYPAKVQGEGAAESICRGIETLDGYGVDVIIAGRGGGSMEDLWAFNEECVARTVFNCRTPVISAVGHETDYTIIDFVADMRAPTPSAAAELAVTEFNKITEEISNRIEMLTSSMRQIIDRYRTITEGYSVRMKYLSPENVLNDRRLKLDDLTDRINAAMDLCVMNRRNMISALCGRMKAASPLTRLESGYAYVAGNDGTAVTSVGDVSKKDRISIYLKDGTVTAVAEEIMHKERQT